MKKILLISLAVAYNFTLVAQNDWKLSKDNNGIKVYSKKEDDAKFKSVKVVCDIEGTIDKLITVLKNISNNKNWVYNTKQSYIIKNVTGNEIIYYEETGLPWPLNNRDVVINMRFNRDDVHKTLTIEANGLQGQPEVKKGNVRLGYFKGIWQITTKDSKHINITYLLTIDPGGSVPAWAYNLFLSTGPYNTFNNLAEQLKKN